MRYELQKIVVTDTKLFAPTGNFGRWAISVEKKFTANAIKEAPIGSDTGRVNKTRGALPVGSLKAMISGDVDRVGPRHFVTTIQSAAPYSVFVIKGTSMIFAKSVRVPAGTPEGGQFREGRGMRIPANPGWGGARWRQRVRGQSANNFFGRAFRATARSHSSLRGQSMLGG